MEYIYLIKILNSKMNISLIINNKAINSNISNERNKKLNISKSKRENERINLNYKRLNIIIYISLIFIFLLLPNKVVLLKDHYIEIKINKIGYNQILSDEYEGALPFTIINDEKPLFMNKHKNVYVNSINDKIILEWTTRLDNFSFMFNNLTNINSIKIYDLFGKKCNFSYMFKNCDNLEKFTYTINYPDSSVIDLMGMFYNCSSLKSFNFHNLYSNYYDYSINYYIDSNNKNSSFVNYTYYYKNMSYMFYNCRNLNSISFDSYYRYINDMKGMFYNCQSLTYINLNNIRINSFIDFSYMFYNCKKLASIDYYRFDAKEVKYMFYNCNSLKQIDLTKFKGTSFYLNMTGFFYNCYGLEVIHGNFSNFNISDTKEMFYNCISLISLDFIPLNVYNYSNMSKMFYNCNNIRKIRFDIHNNYINKCKNYTTILGNNKNTTCNSTNDTFYFPNDLSSLFYNCKSLSSLFFYNFRTDYVIDISYMMYNCQNLNFIYFNSSFFYNNLTINMRGAFQNCKSLISFYFPYFKTRKAEIMWDMFKGCSGLSSIYLGNFDTSQVTDMESMFEGCSSLTSISLFSFETYNVNYMNKMFKDCIKLKTIYFRYISSYSLGTMHQMFYNCKSLEYLNIYRLTENAQTFEELFKGASQNFTFCIQSQNSIPNIFREIYNLENTVMDCSINCYFYERFKSPGSRICCPNYEYNGTCYNKCPGKTKVENITESNICKNFNCTYYYNYEQNGCLDSDIIPDGYYLNDTTYNTIDKCDKSCKTCDSKTNCLICNNDYPYLLSGKCLKNCEYGYYTDSTGIKKCKCFAIECGECTEESIEEGLCKSCADGYYTKADEIIYKAGFKKCYKDPPNYYFHQKNKIYERCYSSCEKCYGDGKEDFHNCKTCNTNHTFVIPKNNNGYQSKNCYKKCDYYYYFDEGKYSCTDSPKCPPKYKYLIPDLRQCIKSCKESNGYFKEFRESCYKECPPEESAPREDNPNLCKVICPFDKPFEIIITQTCVSSCTIMERKDKLCVTNYEGNKTVSQLINVVQSDIIDDITKTFNYSEVTDNETILIEENGTIYEIISTKNKNKNSNTSSIELGKCEYTLKDYYKIDKEDSLYVLKIDTYIEGKTGPTILYKVYYPLLNENKLESLDLTLCEGTDIIVEYPLDLEDSELYDKESPYYHDLCYPDLSSDKVDKIIDDRIQEYTDNNRSLCEEGCEYVGYNKSNKHVECNCEIKINLPLISTIIIDKNKLYQFWDIENMANIDILKCVNLVFSKIGLSKNIGFYFFIPTIIMYFVCIFIFYKKEYKMIMNYINDLIFAKKNLKYLKNKKSRKIKKKLVKGKDKKGQNFFCSFLKAKNVYFFNPLQNKRNKRKNKNNKIIQKSSNLTLGQTIIEEKNEEDDSFEKGENNNKIKDNEEDSKNNDNINNIIINEIKPKNEPPKKIGDSKGNYNPKGKNKSTLKNDLNKNFISFGIKTNSFNKSKNKVLTKEEKKRILEIMKLNERELNELGYKSALYQDRRSFVQFYIGLIKIDHIIFKVMNLNDYNSRIIKIYLFFLNFSVEYSVNSLFFTDKTMHKIYLDEGDFNFIYQLPQMVSSGIISLILMKILYFFALSEIDILSIKREKNIKSLMIKSQNVSKVLFCKFIVFFIFSFIFSMTFWYYVSCFCAVYRNTQFHLIKNTLICFGTSLLSPFGKKLVPGIFRIPGLKNKKPSLYIFSKILQLFL